MAADVGDVVMVTLELPLEVFVFSAIFVLVGSKLMQVSGVLYARGQDWHLVTLAATLCITVPIFGLGLVLLVQNVS